MRLPSSDEQAILQITHRLISRLEIRGLDPRMVTARKGVKLDPKVYKTSVVLPFSLWDKLSPDEWSPLIASCLFYHRNLTKKNQAITVSNTVFPYLTIPLGVLILQLLGLTPLPGWAAAIVILLWILAMVPVATVLYAPFFRGLRKMADTQTLELSIAPSLEQVLRKIANMNIQNHKATKAVERRISDLHKP